MFCQPSKETRTLLKKMLLLIFFIYIGMQAKKSKLFAWIDTIKDKYEHVFFSKVKP